MRTKLLHLKSLLIICLLCIAGGTQAWAQVKDVLTPSLFSIKSTGYDTFTDITGTSGAVYAGVAMKTTDYIQMNKFSKKNSCIVTKTSGGIFKSASVDWNKTSQNLTVYGSHAAFNTSKDPSTQGKPIGTLTATSKTISESKEKYEYVAITATGACYMNSITIEWENVLPPTITPASQTFSAPFTATIASATQGATIYYTLDGTDPKTSPTRATYTDEGITIPAKTTTLKACAELNGETSKVVEAVYTYTKKEPELSFTQESITANYEGSETYINTPKLNNPHKLEVTWSSSDQNVVADENITDGLVIANKMGTTTITATFAGNDEYKTGSVSYNLIVVDPNVNDGSFEKPFTIAEILKKTTDKNKYWVKAYVVGNYYNNKVVTTSNVDTNIALSDVPNASSYDKNNCIPVQLLKGSIKDAFNVKDNPNLIGTEIKVYGSFDKYFSQNGIKETSKISDGSKIKIANKEGYATAYYNCAFEVPENIECGIVTTDGNDGISIDYKYQVGETVPANTGIIVKANSQTSADIIFINSEAQTPTGNLLHGSTSDEYMNAGEGNYLYYKLSYNNDGEKIGFYWGAENGAAFTNQAHKAYLAIPVTNGTSMVRGFALNDIENGTVTNINTINVNTSAKATTIYDLNGRCINNINTAAKGVYIVNGRKVLVK